MAKAFWNYGSYLRRGMAGLGSGRLNVAVLDAVSIGVSIGTKAYGTANSIMFLLSISDLLENYTRKKTRAALAASLSINIDRVWRVEEGGMRQVPMEQIRPGRKSAWTRGTSSLWTVPCCPEKRKSTRPP